MKTESRIRNRQAIRDMETKTGPYYERYVERMTKSFIKTAINLGYRVSNEEPYLVKQ